MVRIVAIGRYAARTVVEREAERAPAPPEDAPLLPRLRGAVEGVLTLAGRRLRTPGAVVFAYHDVVDDPENSSEYSVSPAQLRMHLELATQWGLTFVDLATLTDAFLRGEPLDGLAAIVFDDCLVGVHHSAMAILLELGLPATLFAVTDRLGESPAWWTDVGRVMTESELSEMSAAGFRVESHTRTHASLVAIEGADLDDEIRGSKGRLEDLLGVTSSILAYPYGHYDKQVTDLVASAGYEAAYSFANGRVVHGMQRFTLPRLCMTRSHTKPVLAYHLARRAESWPVSQLPAIGPR